MNPVMETQIHITCPTVKALAMKCRHGSKN